MSETLKKLLYLLADGQFHSGERLGSLLGVTRSAVWKLIQQLPEWDIEIESQTAKGYRIKEPLMLLDEKAIKNALAPNLQAKLTSIDILDTLSSTNDYLIQKSRDLNQYNGDEGKAIVCLAERQTKGRGRFGRQWVSPFAKNIYLSLLWHFPQDPSELSGLSLAISVAIIETLNGLGIKEGLHLKWPNDVLYQNQKLAGTLLELSGESHNTCSTVIGIGLNVLSSMPSSKTENISQPWTNIQSIIQNIPDRNQIAGLLLNELLKTVLLFQEQGLKPFLAKWQQLDLSLGRRVTLKTPKAEIQGISQGINEKGHFQLKTENGEVLSFSSGEVSLRMQPAVKEYS